jgi:hypothetical protein
MRQCGTTSLLEVLILVGVIVVLGIMASGGGCLGPKTDEAESRRVLEAHGFTAIQFTGFELWGCGRQDWQHTGFRARGVDGSAVAGVVCCGGSTGCGKACTVRLR